MSNKIKAEFLYADERLEKSEKNIDEAKKWFSSINWERLLSEMPEEPNCNPTISFYKDHENHHVWASIVEKNMFYLGARIDNREEFISADGANSIETQDILNLYLDENYDEMFSKMQQIESRYYFNVNTQSPSVDIFARLKSYAKKLFT